MTPKKENLILVHSFPTNSILLAGLAEYLGDYSQVYFIDLPGFSKSVPALAEVSLAGYAHFMEEKIRALGLDHYWLVGISFGFLVVSALRPAPQCRGIIALEPLLGPESLRMGPLKRAWYGLACQGILKFNLASRLWRHPLCQGYITRSGQYPPHQVGILFNQIDGQTFFQTAGLILSNQHRPACHPLPHVLIANEADQVIDYHYVLRHFTAQAPNLLVVNTTIEHYPRDVSQAYFRRKIPEDAVQHILAFMATAPFTPAGQPDPIRVAQEKPRNQSVLLNDYRTLRCT